MRGAAATLILKVFLELGLRLPGYRQTHEPGMPVLRRMISGSKFLAGSNPTFFAAESDFVLVLLEPVTCHGGRNGKGTTGTILPSGSTFNSTLVARTLLVLSKERGMIHSYS